MTSKPNGDVSSAPSQAEELEILKRRREKRKLKREGNKAPKNGLTSMIDIVFLLIFFFMVVTDLQQMEIEPIDLPFAVMAEPEPEGGPKRIVVNIDQSGQIKLMGFRLESEGLFKELRRAAADGPQDSETGLPDLVVKIRADQAVEYQKVQDVMVQCMRSKLWRVSFGARPDVDELDLVILPEAR